MDSETVLQRAEEAHLRLVRFMYCDNGGIIRGKASHINGLKDRMAEGIGQSLAMQAFAGVDALAAVDGMGPVGEFRLVPDPDTFVVLPYASLRVLCGESLLLFRLDDPMTRSPDCTSHQPPATAFSHPGCSYSHSE